MVVLQGVLARYQDAQRMALSSLICSRTALSLQNSPAGQANGMLCSSNWHVNELAAEVAATRQGMHLPKAPLAQDLGAPICTPAHFYAIPVLRGSCGSNTGRLPGEGKYDISQAAHRRTCKSNGLKY